MVCRSAVPLGLVLALAIACSAVAADPVYTVTVSGTWTAAGGTAQFSPGPPPITGCGACTIVVPDALTLAVEVAADTTQWTVGTGGAAASLALLAPGLNGTVTVHATQCRLSTRQGVTGAVFAFDGSGTAVEVFGDGLNLGGVGGTGTGAASSSLSALTLSTVGPTPPNSPTALILSGTGVLSGVIGLQNGTLSVRGGQRLQVSALSVLSPTAGSTFGKPSANLQVLPLNPATGDVVALANGGGGLLLGANVGLTADSYLNGTLRDPVTGLVSATATLQLGFGSTLWGPNTAGLWCPVTLQVPTSSGVVAQQMVFVAGGQVVVRGPLVVPSLVTLYLAGARENSQFGPGTASLDLYDGFPPTDGSGMPLPGVGPYGLWLSTSAELLISGGNVTVWASLTLDTASVVMATDAGAQLRVPQLTLSPTSPVSNAVTLAGDVQLGTTLAGTFTNFMELLIVAPAPWNVGALNGPPVTFTIGGNVAFAVQTTFWVSARSNVHVLGAGRITSNMYFASVNEQIGANPSQMVFDSGATVIGPISGQQFSLLTLVGPAAGQLNVDGVGRVVLPAFLWSAIVSVGRNAHLVLTDAQALSLGASLVSAGGHITVESGVLQGAVACTAAANLTLGGPVAFDGVSIPDGASLTLGTSVGGASALAPPLLYVRGRIDVGTGSTLVTQTAAQLQPNFAVGGTGTLMLSAGSMVGPSIEQLQIATLIGPPMGAAFSIISGPVVLSHLTVAGALFVGSNSATPASLTIGVLTVDTTSELLPSAVSAYGSGFACSLTDGSALTVIDGRALSGTITCSGSRCALNVTGTVQPSVPQAPILADAAVNSEPWYQNGNIMTIIGPSDGSSQAQARQPLQAHDTPCVYENQLLGQLRVADLSQLVVESLCVPATTLLMGTGPSLRCPAPNGVQAVYACGAMLNIAMNSIWVTALHGVNTSFGAVSVGQQSTWLIEYGDGPVTDVHGFTVGQLWLNSGSAQLSMQPDTSLVVQDATLAPAWQGGINVWGSSSLTVNNFQVAAGSTLSVSGGGRLYVGLAILIDGTLSLGGYMWLGAPPGQSVYVYADTPTGSGGSATQLQLAMCTLDSSVVFAAPPDTSGGASTLSVIGPGGGAILTLVAPFTLPVLGGWGGTLLITGNGSVAFGPGFGVVTTASIDLTPTLVGVDDGTSNATLSGLITVGGVFSLGAGVRVGDELRIEGLQVMSGSGGAQGAGVTFAAAPLIAAPTALLALTNVRIWTMQARGYGTLRLGTAYVFAPVPRGSIAPTVHLVMASGTGDSVTLGIGDIVHLPSLALGSGPLTVGCMGLVVERWSKASAVQSASFVWVEAPVRVLGGDVSGVSFQFSSPQWSVMPALTIVNSTLSTAGLVVGGPPAINQGGVTVLQLTTVPGALRAGSLLVALSGYLQILNTTTITSGTAAGSAPLVLLVSDNVAFVGPLTSSASYNVLQVVVVSGVVQLIDSFLFAVPWSIGPTGPFPPTSATPAMVVCASPPLAIALPGSAPVGFFAPVTIQVGASLAITASAVTFYAPATVYGTLTTAGSLVSPLATYVANAPLTLKAPTAQVTSPYGLQLDLTNSVIEAGVAFTPSIGLILRGSCSFGVDPLSPLTLAQLTVTERAEVAFYCRTSTATLNVGQLGLLPGATIETAGSTNLQLTLQSSSTYFETDCGIANVIVLSGVAVDSGQTALWLYGVPCADGVSVNSVALANGASLSQNGLYVGASAGSDNVTLRVSFAGIDISTTRMSFTGGTGVTLLSSAAFGPVKLPSLQLSTCLSGPAIPLFPPQVSVNVTPAMGCIATDMFTGCWFGDPCADKAYIGCTSSQTGPVCECPPGRTGVQCQTAIDYCADAICSPGVTCQNVVGGYRCVCDAGGVVPIAPFGPNNCRVCPSGTSSPPGGTTCTPCDAGTAARPYSAQCAPCNPGYYAAARSMSACVPCPEGTYSPNPGATQCVPCPAVSNGDELTAANCPAGSFVPNVDPTLVTPKTSYVDPLSDSIHQQLLTVNAFHTSLAIAGVVVTIGVMALCALLSACCAQSSKWLHFERVDALHALQARPKDVAGGILTIGTLCASVLLIIYACYDFVEVYTTSIRFSAELTTGSVRNNQPLTVAVTLVGLLPSLCDPTIVTSGLNGLQCDVNEGRGGTGGPKFTPTALEPVQALPDRMGCVARFTCYEPVILGSASALLTVNATDTSAYASAVRVYVTAPHYSSGSYEMDCLSTPPPVTPDPDSALAATAAPSGGAALTSNATSATLFQGAYAASISLALTRTVYLVNTDPTYDDNPLGYAVQVANTQFGDSAPLAAPPLPGVPMSVLVQFLPLTGANLVSETPISSPVGLLAQVLALVGGAFTIFAAALRIKDYAHDRWRERIGHTRNTDAGASTGLCGSAPCCLPCTCACCNGSGESDRGVVNDEAAAAYGVMPDGADAAAAFSPSSGGGAAAPLLAGDRSEAAGPSVVVTVPSASAAVAVTPAPAATGVHLLAGSVSTGVRAADSPPIPSADSHAVQLHPMDRS